MTCDNLRGMEIIQPVADLFVSAVTLGAFVLSGLFFSVIVSNIIPTLFE